MDTWVSGFGFLIALCMREKEERTLNMHVGKRIN